MDIAKQPIEKRRAWLAQRGWLPKPGQRDVFIDPDTRTPYYIDVALRRALADCHIDGDTQLNPVVPPRKDDAPPIPAPAPPPKK